MEHRERTGKGDKDDERCKQGIYGGEKLGLSREERKKPV